MNDVTMDRTAAAALLGVPVDADADDVRRAYRLWARMVHPDLGGDPVHFARLTRARHLLLEAPRATAPGGPDVTEPDEPAPRAPLRTVVAPPTRLVLLAVLLTACALAMTALPRWGASAPAAALACGLLAAACTVVAARSILQPGADAGHRITVHVLIWLPIVTTLVIASVMIGTGFVSVLPLLALPFVAVIGSLNAGAGLWRPIAGHRS